MSRYYRMRPALPPTREIPYSRSTARQRVATRMDPRKWALAFVGAVLGKTDYKSSANPFYSALLVVDVAGNGRYVKGHVLSGIGEIYGPAKWYLSHTYYRAFDSLPVLQLQLKVQALQEQIAAHEHAIDVKRQQDLQLLSQNTVTRALVHASSNDYCSETAVALISAGHKMPDVTLSVRVTIDCTVELPGNDNYYPLRALFGATGGEVEGAHGISAVEHSDKVRSAITEQLQSGDLYFGYDDVSHTGTSVEWHAPVLRQVSNSDAYNQVNHHGADD